MSQHSAHFDVQKSCLQRCFTPFVVPQRLGFRRANISHRCSANNQPDNDAMREALSDPKVREQIKAYEEAMKDPAVQKQAQLMAQTMQSPEMQQKFAALREDPELKELFEDVEKGGMQAAMKYMNDNKWLSKVQAKLGDVPQPQQAATPQPAANPPEIKDIIDAAKYGDLEAVEDFIAVGKDLNQRDSDNRTALHYAVAYKQTKVFNDLVASGADLTAEDNLGNTPLHYAAGYGRSEFVKDLIDAGAKGFSKNTQGHTPYDLVRMEKTNPINNDRELMKLLEVASSS